MAFQLITRHPLPNSVPSITLVLFLAAPLAMANTPTLDELMAEGATPRRTPILDHAAVVKAIIEWFQNKSKWRAAEAEMSLPQAEPSSVIRRADVIAWNRDDHEFYIIEAKAQWNDFIRDRKFFEYQKWCTWFAFAVPEELAACARKRMEAVPGWYEGVGLLVIPNAFGNRRMIRRPAENKMSRPTYTKMVEQWAASCRSRLVGERLKVAELEYRLPQPRVDEALRRAARQ